LAAKEQTMGMNEIASAMSQLDTVTQDNVTAVEDSAEYSNHIFLQAETLNKTLHELEERVLIGTHNQEQEMDIINGPDSFSESSIIPIESKRRGEPKQAPKKKVYLKAAGNKIPSSEDHEFEDV
jgi:hypothetical protein